MKRIDAKQQGQASVWVALILVLVGAYVVMTFLPPWYKSWKAKSVVGEVVSGYSTQGLDEERLLESVKRALNDMGVDVADGDIHINLNKEDKTIAIVVNWKAEFNYFLSRRKTSLNFVIKLKRKLS
jgi:hypothetical protein